MMRKPSTDTSFGGTWPHNLPPPGVLLGALDLLREDEDNERERWKWRAQLIGMVDNLEHYASFDMSSFVVAGEERGCDLNGAKRIGQSYRATISLLEDGVIADLLAIYAADALPRYVSAYDRALVRLKQIHGVLTAAVQREEGRAKGESADERLARAISNATNGNVEPITLPNLTSEDAGQHDRGAG